MNKIVLKERALKKIKNLGGEKEEKMNKKKVFTCIAVLLVALVSMSSIIYASQEGNAKSGLPAAQSGNETQPEEAEEKPVRYMFVQSAHSGSFVPVEGEMNYTLTLEGISAQTIAFSDRPERVVEQVPMQKFLDGLGFSPKHPANAAIEILEGNESEDAMVMELFDPIYDAANKTLQYNVSVLEMPNHSYAIFNERHDESLPEHFGPAALFIDDCWDCYMQCASDDKGEHNCGSFKTGQYWCWKPPSCVADRSESYYKDKCTELFGDNCKYAFWNSCGYSESCP
jgi:hypothetical protein